MFNRWALGLRTCRLAWHDLWRCCYQLGAGVLRTWATAVLCVALRLFNPVMWRYKVASRSTRRPYPTRNASFACFILPIAYPTLLVLRYLAEVNGLGAVVTAGNPESLLRWLVRITPSTGVLPRRNLPGPATGLYLQWDVQRRICGGLPHARRYRGSWQAYVTACAQMSFRTAALLGDGVHLSSFRVTKLGFKPGPGYIQCSRVPVSARVADLHV